MTLGQLRANTTAAELPLWMAYSELHGFPQDRAEATTAIAGSALCQTWGAKVRPNDLMPVYGRENTVNDDAVLSAWAAQHNAHVTRANGERKSR